MGNGPANGRRRQGPRRPQVAGSGQPAALAAQVPFNGKWYQDDHPSGKTNDQHSREVWLEAQAS